MGGQTTPGMFSATLRRVVRQEYWPHGALSEITQGLCVAKRQDMLPDAPAFPPGGPTTISSIGIECWSRRASSPTRTKKWSASLFWSASSRWAGHSSRQPGLRERLTQHALRITGVCRRLTAFFGHHPPYWNCFWDVIYFPTPAPIKEKPLHISGT